jgi:hypothetical protein
MSFPNTLARVQIEKNKKAKLFRLPSLQSVGKVNEKPALVFLCQREKRSAAPGTVLAGKEGMWRI